MSASLALVLLWELSATAAAVAAAAAAAVAAASASSEALRSAAIESRKAVSKAELN